MYWEMRHPKLAIASFWLRWLVGWPLAIAVFPLWFVTQHAMLAVAWLIDPYDVPPWKKSNFLREEIRREAECKRQTPND